MFFIIEHHSRRAVHVGVTRSPSDAGVAPQIREATPFGERPRCLICDRDNKYGPHFELAASGIEILHTPPCAPKANAICERFIGSVLRECLKREDGHSESLVVMSILQHEYQDAMSARPDDLGTSPG